MVFQGCITIKKTTSGKIDGQKPEKRLELIRWPNILWQNKPLSISGLKMAVCVYTAEVRAEVEAGGNGNICTALIMNIFCVPLIKLFFPRSFDKIRVFKRSFGEICVFYAMFWRNVRFSRDSLMKFVILGILWQNLAFFTSTLRQNLHFFSWFFGESYFFAISWRNLHFFLRLMDGILIFFAVLCRNSWSFDKILPFLRFFLTKLANFYG